MDLFLISLFFFSSRRRHTRWPRDWSSDVCSSDLPPHSTPRAPTLRRCVTCSREPTSCSWTDTTPNLRSEERRVGKEGRSRGARGDSQEKRKMNKHIEAPKLHSRDTHCVAGLCKQQ